MPWLFLLLRSPVDGSVKAFKLRPVRPFVQHVPWEEFYSWEDVVDPRVWVDVEQDLVDPRNVHWDAFPYSFDGVSDTIRKEMEKLTRLDPML